MCVCTIDREIRNLLILLNMLIPKMRLVGRVGAHKVMLGSQAFVLGMYVVNS